MPSEETYPGLNQAFANNVPVVTTLLASLSVALVVVPATRTDTSEAKLHHLPWTSSQLSIVAGTGAAILFVLATVCAVYGAALQPWPNAQGTQPTWDETAATRGWNTRVRILWAEGLPAFLVCLGATTFDQVPLMLPVTCVVGALISIAACFQGGFGWLARTASILLAVASVVLAFAT